MIVYECFNRTLLISFSWNIGTSVLEKKHTILWKYFNSFPNQWLIHPIISLIHGVLSTCQLVFQASWLNQLVLNTALCLACIYLYIERWLRPLCSMPDPGPGRGALERRQSWSNFSRGSVQCWRQLVSHYLESVWLLLGQRGEPVKGACGKYNSPTMRSGEYLRDAE